MGGSRNGKEPSVADFVGKHPGTSQRLMGECGLALFAQALINNDTTELLDNTVADGDPVPGVDGSVRVLRACSQINCAVKLDLQIAADSRPAQPSPVAMVTAGCRNV